MKPIFFLQIDIRKSARKEIPIELNDPTTVTEDKKTLFFTFQVSKDVAPVYTEHVINQVQNRFDQLMIFPCRKDWKKAYNIVVNDFPDYTLTKGFYLRELGAEFRKKMTVMRSL